MDSLLNQLMDYNYQNLLDESDKSILKKLHNKLHKKYGKITSEKLNKEIMSNYMLGWYIKELQKDHSTKKAPPVDPH